MEDFKPDHCPICNEPASMLVEYEGEKEYLCDFCLFSWPKPDEVHSFLKPQTE